MEEQGAATFLDCESHEPIYYKFTRAPFLPDLHLRMYYHEAFHGADISHKMASKSISMRKFPTEPPGETLTNKLLTATATSANLGADLKTSTEVSKPKVRF